MKKVLKFISKAISITMIAQFATVMPIEMKKNILDNAVLEAHATENNVSLYSDIVQEYTETYGRLLISNATGSVNCSMVGTYFQLIDFNSDGLDELYIVYKGEHHDPFQTIYAIENERVKCIMPPMQGFRMKSSQKNVIID